MSTQTTTQPAALPAADIHVATEKTSGGDLAIQPINRSSVRFEFQGKQFYVDPSGDADWDRMPKADYIFVTHEHGDHFDLAAIEKIAQPSATVYTTEASIKKIEDDRAKFANLPAHIEPIVAGQITKFSVSDSDTIRSDFTVEAVPAYNVSEAKKNFHPKDRGDVGYVLTFGDTRVYIAGDTEATPEMKALKNIDIAFLPCDPRYTMSVEECAAAANVLQPKIFYPNHQGPSNPNDVKKLLAGEKGIDVRVLPLP